MCIRDRDSSVPGAVTWEKAWKDGDGVMGMGREIVGGWVARARKRLDLWGNDRYLAHVFQMVKWWTRPTHVVVLGDLVGSQWIGDEEFWRRRDRFWGTVFRGMEMVGHNEGMLERGTWMERLGEEAAGEWERKLIAVAGNHDVGYAGDLDEGRVDRFEKGFGKVNWEVRFRLDRNESSTESTGLRAGPEALFDQPPELRLVILNSMNLDSPAYKPALREQSLEYLSEHLTNPSPAPHSKTGTILLTHIPLHKPAGLCVDSPYFSYVPASQHGGVREQNHLSEDMSRRILDGLTKKGSAIVLNGHDHEGCDTVHTHDLNTKDWQATHYPDLVSDPAAGLREITVRSMMGDFGGNAGLLSAWYSTESGQWEFAYESCIFGVQHIWWGIWVLVIVEGALGLGGAVAWFAERREGHREGRRSLLKVKKG